MAKHGLTRVTYDGDKVIVVAGPVPQHIADSMTAAARQENPMTPLHIEPQPVLPARKLDEVQEVKPQAEVAKEKTSGK